MCFTSTLRAEHIDVEVTGVEGALLENVLAHLSVYRHRESERLTTSDIRRLHRKAKKEILQALAPLGYYSPEVRADLQDVGEMFRAAYDISKGEPVRVTRVNITVEEGEGDDTVFYAVKEQFPLQQGEILNHGLYENGKKAILRTAFNNGYLEASFEYQELRVDREKKEAEIVLHLVPGAQFVFGETLFEESGVNGALLEKMIPYEKGDPYRPSELLELQKILYRSNYFSRVVVDGKVNERSNLAVPVMVYLTVPEKRNQYSVGLGYATDTGPRARLQWKNKLLNAKGHTLSSTVQASKYESNVGFDYKVPWGNPNNDKIGLRSSYNDQNWDDTETQLFTLGVGLEHNTSVISHGGGLEFRDEDYSVGSTSGRARLIVPSFTTNVILADDLHLTRYGIQISTSVSGAMEDVGSDISYLKGLVSGKVILTPFEGWRLIGRGTLGATVVDSIDDLPPSLRFYAGGDQSVRGYGYKEIGPEDESGTIVGGRYLAVGSIEAEKEWKKDWSFAAFWDVGNATNDLGLDFKQGAGVGVRYRLPFGQIRLDLACAVLEDDTPVRLHLTAGADL